MSRLIILVTSIVVFAGLSGTLHAQPDEWDVVLASGVEFRDVLLLEFRESRTDPHPDSISVDLMIGGVWVGLDSIYYLRRQGRMYVGEGIAAGLLLGAVIGVSLPVLDRNGSFGPNGVSLFDNKVIQALSLGLLGGLVGGVVGAVIDGDDAFDLRALTRAEQSTLIRRLLVKP